jgi:16S rRNA (guanine966-N2)-methyltransferase
MRIIGGRARGLHLAPVGDGDPAAHLRPTSDRVREAIFNLLINGKLGGSQGNPITGARVLDLFAGTGALGLEALSRGAARVAFVDDGVASRALLRRNIELMRAMGETDVWRRDATRLGPIRGAPYDLIFLDPPYSKGLGEAALASALAGGWIAPGATVVWEEATAPVPPPGLIQLDQRSYGDTIVTILRHDAT